MNLAPPVFALAAAVLCYETALVRLLPLSHWQPFVTLALGTALLGFGFAGSVLLWLGRHILPRRQAAFSFFAALTALSFRPVLIAASALRLEPGLIFRSPDQWLILALLGAVLTVPFAFGALALALPLLEKETVGRYYGYNLLGSCLGVLMALASMDLLPLPWLPCIPTGAAWMSCILALNPLRRPRVNLVAILAAAAVTFWPPGTVSYGPYKDISYALRMPGSVWHPAASSASGLLEAVEAPGLRSAAGLSTRYGGSLPSQAGLYRDGDRAGTILMPTGPGDPGLDYLQWQTAAAPYAALPAGRKVAILGFDGGEEAFRALGGGASRVVYVEPDGAASGLPLRRDGLFPPWAFGSGRIAFDVEGGRSHLARKKGSYGAVVFTLGGSLASAVAGLGGAAEGYDLTAEGITAAVDALAPLGVVAISGWNQAPPTARLKLLQTLAAVPRLGAESWSDGRVLIVTGWSTHTVIVAPEPLEEGQRQSLEDFCRIRSFGLTTGEAFAASEGRVDAGDRELLDLAPSTDRRPYPWHALRVSFLWRLTGERREEAFPRVEWSFLFLLMALALAAAISFPLLALSRPSGLGTGEALTALTSFFLLGVGYMTVEILLIKRVGLVLSPAVLAAAAVLGPMLLGSGLGSLSSERVAGRPRLALLVFPASAALTLVSYSALPLVAGMGFGWRLAASAAAASAPAFVMGLPFPLFLGRLPGRREMLVPWSWAVSGYASVMGSSLAGVLAVTAGLDWLLVLGGGCYLSAGGVYWWVVGKESPVEVSQRCV